MREVDSSKNISLADNFKARYFTFCLYFVVKHVFDSLYFAFRVFDPSFAHFIIVDGKHVSYIPPKI